MAEDNRRVSTTPIPVPVPFGAPQPTPSPLGQTPAPTGATEHATTETTTPSAPTAADSNSKDVAMTDAEQAPSPAPAPTTAAATPQQAPQGAASPAPASGAAAGGTGGRTGTPLRTTNGAQEATTGPASRAASAHPDPGFTMPAEAPPHGAPARQYLNNKVTGVLLEGMKLLAKEQPKDPLRVLGEFLIQRSKEIEGSG